MSGNKLWGKMKKASADISAKTVASSKNTKEALSIQKKQNMILDRKKSFGVEYLDLMERDATPEELEACVGRAMDEIATMRGKVAKYKERIATNEAKLDLKLSTTPNNTKPSVTVTDAEGNEEEKTPHASDASEKPASPTATATAVPANEEDNKTPIAAAVAIQESGPNPFGDDDEEEEAKKPASVNPFGDDDEEEEETTKQSAPPASTNPFGDDDDEEEETKKPASTNPFGDDDDDEPPSMAKKPASANPFDDDDEEEETPKAPSNPFDDDDDVAKPSRSASSNPFDDD